VVVARCGGDGGSRDGARGAAVVVVVVTLNREKVLRLFHVFTFYRVAEWLALVPSSVHCVHPIVVDARVEPTAHHVISLALRHRCSLLLYSHYTSNLAMLHHNNIVFSSFFYIYKNVWQESC
jgi:Na+/H+ antiporter NhaA